MKEHLEHLIRMSILAMEWEAAIMEEVSQLGRTEEEPYQKI